MGALAFNGNVSHTIDPKGRATIPVSYREALGDNFTVALNSEANALALYPRDQWELIESDLNRIPTIDARGMRYKRSILGNSFPEQQLDGQNRVLLPMTLRQRVNIDRNVRFVGVGTHLEVWPEEQFLEEMEDATSDRDDLLSYVMGRYYPPQ